MQVTKGVFREGLWTSERAMKTSESSETVFLRRTLRDVRKLRVPEIQE
jgi:hypothetical protein